MAAVAESYATFGQRKPIVARREGKGGVVIAGNHQLEAARELGWEKIPVVWVEDDDITAKALALADNRTADLGSYDDSDLLAMLQTVREADMELSCIDRLRRCGAGRAGRVAAAGPCPALGVPTREWTAAATVSTVSCTL